MFCLLLVASFVLPSVLGGCCTPDQMSAVIYRAGETGNETLVTDFKQNKYIVRPSEGDVKYELTDLTEQKIYTRFLDGSCTFEKVTRPLSKCIPNDIKQLPTAHFAGQLVDTYAADLGKGATVTMVVTKRCYPVLLVEAHDGEVITEFYTGVTTIVSDSEIEDLNQKVDDCSEEA